MKDLKPRNSKDQPHGLWEWYYSNGQLGYKGNFINGKQDGLWEWYFSDGRLWYKEYHV